MKKYDKIIFVCYCSDIISVFTNDNVLVKLKYSQLPKLTFFKREVTDSIYLSDVLERYGIKI